MYRVFVCHAQEDRDYSVSLMAIDLMEAGIEPVIDNWTMKDDEGLLDKILLEGVKDADLFLVVASNKSINKAWFKVEIDQFLISGIKRICKMLVLKVDDCLLPKALAEVQQVEFNRFTGKWLQEIKTLLNSNDIVGRFFSDISGLTQDEALVFSMACFSSLQNCNSVVNFSEVYQFAKEYAFAEERLQDILNCLDEKNYIGAIKTFSNKIPAFEIKTAGLDAYLRIALPDYEGSIKNICSLLVEGKVTVAGEIAKSVNQSERIVKHVFDVLENAALIKLGKNDLGCIFASTVSPDLANLV